MQVTLKATLRRDYYVMFLHPQPCYDSHIMALSDYVNTYGQDLLARFGQKVHKLAINAGFTCPNRDGTKSRGGCSFCNNISFNPNARHPLSISEQIEAGRRVVVKRTGARRYIAYFQAYTNSYADVTTLSHLYEQALAEPDVVGLAIGTRPDCVPDQVLDLLASYRDRNYEVWLELGLQSAFDDTLLRINRGHGFAEYRDAVKRASLRELPICTHLIVGLPGEGRQHAMISLERVLALGTQGLKLHPMHVVKGTQLANEWRNGHYHPLALEDFVTTVADLIQATPPSVVYHRITGTASPEILLAPLWCAKKWLVINAIEDELYQRRSVSNQLLHTLIQPTQKRPIHNGIGLSCG